MCGAIDRLIQSSDKGMRTEKKNNLHLEDDVLILLSSLAFNYIRKLHGKKTHIPK